EKVVPAQAPTKAPAQPFELRIHTRVGTDLDQYFVTVLDEFKQIVPEATVKIEAVPGGALEYASKVLVLHAGGQIGDALWSASRVGFNRRFMAVGIFAPLDPFVEAEHFDVGQYYPYCIEEATYEGKLMALPHISEPGQVGLVLNLDLFERAGAAPITWESTLDELLQAAIAISKLSGDRKVFGFSRDTNYFNWVTMVRSFGGDFLNP
ncbi:MAG: extracellular solute-binding protein, partial [Clostridia bacterium]|nr:extracellular solute-binding protein [Clostridia bacterium]